ncbi:MAG: GNAT family N-acetyltransferase [Rubrobacteraceae bacterium]
MSSVVNCGFRIRRMTDADLARVMELRAVVRWATEPEAFKLLRGMRDARWAVAEDVEGRIRGMVGAVPLGDIGILCHLAVHEEHRRRGLGARLASWAVAYLKSRGAKTVRLYTTPQAEGLYRTIGFEPGEFRTVYRLEKESNRGWSSNETGGYRIETLLAGDLPELYGVDRWSYGADRSHIIFATLRLHPGLGLVARDSSGRMKGYLIRSSSHGATRIGPFVAENNIVARLLLARAIETGDMPVRLTVPGESPAHEILREFGFSGHADRLRMEMGDVGLPKPRGLDHYATTAYLAT